MYVTAMEVSIHCCVGWNTCRTDVYMTSVEVSIHCGVGCNTCRTDVFVTAWKCQYTAELDGTHVGLMCM